jgi:hypothetical protein
MNERTVSILPQEILLNQPKDTQRRLILIGQYAARIDGLARKLREIGNLETNTENSNVFVCVKGESNRKLQSLKFKIRYDDGGYLASVQVEATENGNSPWHLSYLGWDIFQDSGMGPLRQGPNDLLLTGPFFKIKPYLPFVPSNYRLPLTDETAETCDGVFSKIERFSKKLARGNRAEITDGQT